VKKEALPEPISVNWDRGGPLPKQFLRNPVKLSEGLKTHHHPDTSITRQQTICVIIH
jgi:hypothetical protein